jgi:hypothetical protein
MNEAYLIRNTTRSRREEIVREALGNTDGMCDGCANGLGEEFYQPYIDGELEISELNRGFQTHYIRDDGPDAESPRVGCPIGGR